MNSRLSKAKIAMTANAERNEVVAYLATQPLKSKAHL